MKPARACPAIELLVVDVDGVLTDGGIVYGSNGVELKRFHVARRFGLEVCRKKRANVPAILTGARPPVVERRKELGIGFVDPGCLGQVAGVSATTGRERNVTPGQVCYVGDDLPDLPPLRHCGLAVAVADAYAEVRSVAHYVTRSTGGQGAVRETIELILRCQGLWHSFVEAGAAKVCSFLTAVFPARKTGRRTQNKGPNRVDSQAHSAVSVRPVPLHVGILPLWARPGRHRRLAAVAPGTVGAHRAKLGQDGR